MRGLAERLQNEYHVIPCGPTTLSALLSSLQVGFKTLAVEERSAEVWKTLTALQTDFSAFCGMLEAARSRMRLAAESIDRAAARSRSIESRLKIAEEIPGPLPPEAAEEAQDAVINPTDPDFSETGRTESRRKQ